MRIIAGSCRGRKLKAVEGLKVRPTADKVKEAVFSAVNAYIYDCEFLDVFGGTGAMALEAVSRGAKEAVILEKDRDAQKTISDNIALCGFAKKCVLLKGDSLQSLEKLGREKRQFDLIYIDPPYQAGLYQNVLEKIAAGNLLKKEGLILTETPREMEVLLDKVPFQIIKEKYYGICKISTLSWDIDAAIKEEE